MIHMLYIDYDGKKIIDSNNIAKLFNNYVIDSINILNINFQYNNNPSNIFELINKIKVQYLKKNKNIKHN